MKQLKRLLVPTDFSKAARNAVDYAAALAVDLQAELHLVHVVQLPTVVHSGAFFDINVREQLLQEANEQMKRRQQSLLKQWPDLQLNTKTFLGKVEEGLPQQATELKADLIVMGTEGSSGLKRLVGSNTYATIRHAPCPVLSVPEKSAYRKLQQLVFACALDQLSQEAPFRWLNQLAELLQLRVLVLTIDPDMRLTVRSEQQIQQTLDRVFADVPHRLQLLAGGETSETLRDYVQAKQPDWLFMLPRHHNFLERMLQGSLTRSLVYHPEVPLLTIREDQLADI